MNLLAMLQRCRSQNQRPQCQQTILRTAATDPVFARYRPDTNGDSLKQNNTAFGQLEQRDVFLLVAHLRQLLPESVVTLQQVSGRATEVSDTAEVSFEISVQLATG